MNELTISLPFSYYLNEDEGIKTSFPKEESVLAYLEALNQEISVEPLEANIEVLRYMGDVTAMNLKTFEKLHRRLLSYFKTDTLKESTIRIFPGVLSLASMSSFKTLKITNIVIEAPTFIDEEMKTYALPNIHSAMDQTIYMFENFQMHNYGIRTYRSIPKRSAERYMSIAKELIRLQPSFIEFVVFDETCKDENFEVLANKLSDCGYKQSGNNFYKDSLPLYLSANFENIYGYGLGAVSKGDGAITKTTNDINLYVKSSAYFDEIVESVERYEK